MEIKNTSLALLAVIAVTILGSFSVIGMLQSTERVTTSGIILIQPPPEVPDSPPIYPPYIPSPPEPTLDIEVYSNIQCTQIATSIDWGTIEVGSQIERILYIKNVGDTAVILSLSSQNWEPTTTSQYIQLSWDFTGSNVSPGSVVPVTLTLLVSPSISGIENFNFDIVFLGEPAT